MHRIRVYGAPGNERCDSFEMGIAPGLGLFDMEVMGAQLSSILPGQGACTYLTRMVTHLMPHVEMIGWFQFQRVFPCTKALQNDQTYVYSS